MFPFARVLRTAPPEIARQVAEKLAENGSVAGQGEVLPTGPYVNIRFALTSVASQVMGDVESLGDRYGHTDDLKGRKVMIEFSCPNTNKPLHLGHLRNDSLGYAVSHILEANGAEVRRVNLINDRGIHICKSMLAYQVFGQNATPESTGVKSDHFVGDYYVKYNKWSQEDTSAEEKARKMLQQWEAGDPEVRELWTLMNRWAVEGIQETYEKTNIEFDKIYYESETFSQGREEVLKGLEAGVFYRDEKGTVWVDLEEAGLDKKVLLRGDGTTLYLTQDIGTAIARHDDWPFEELIYVVGSEQKYHFQVLFHVLGLLGFEWAKNLYHLSYGMVNLPEGKMKSREGKVVDADDLIDELTEMAAREIRGKGREEDVEDIEETGRKVALAALNYYLLQVTPSKDMIFNPAESLSFTGNTGPYLQYMGARISSVLRKYEALTGPRGKADPSLLTVPEERELIKQIAGFPGAVSQAGRDMNPSILAVCLYELCKTYSRYYHDNQVLRNENPDLVATRVQLSRAVLQVLKNGFPLLGIPFLEKM
jgi:arginyl-tRNA synthetase